MRSQTTGLAGGTSYEKKLVTTYAYDKLNRQTEMTEAANGTSELRITTTVYDDVGNVTKVIDPLSHWTTYAYDALYRQTEVTQSAHSGGAAARRTTTTLYDPGNLVGAVIDPLSRATVYAYDGLDRRTMVFDAECKLTHTEYSLTGTTDMVKDPLGNLTTFTHDNLDRVTDEKNAADVDGGNHGRTFTYDAEGNLTAKTDRENRETKFVYDLLDCPIVETWHNSPGGSTIRTLSYGYDAAHNLLGAIEYNVSVR